MRNGHPTKGYKKATVIEVKEPWTENDIFSGPRSFAGYIIVEENVSGKTHTFVDGSINRAPIALHRLGAKCWVGWMKTSSTNLPHVKPTVAKR